MYYGYYWDDDIGLADEKTIKMFGEPIIENEENVITKDETTYYQKRKENSFDKVWIKKEKQFCISFFNTLFWTLLLLAILCGTLIKPSYFTILMAEIPILIIAIAEKSNETIYKGNMLKPFYITTFDVEVTDENEINLLNEILKYTKYASKKEADTSFTCMKGDNDRDLNRLNEITLEYIKKYQSLGGTLVE